MDRLAAILEEDVWLAKQKSARITDADELRRVDHRAVIAWEPALSSLFGVIVESSRNRTLRRIEESRARIAKGPEGILERFSRPNVIAVKSDVFPSQRSDMGEQGIVDDVALRA